MRGLARRISVVGRVPLLCAALMATVSRDAQAACYRCEYSLGLGGWYCQPFAIMGYPDCFGPMLPSLFCSMYGEYTFFCAEDDEELVLSADGLVVGSLGSDWTAATMLRHRRLVLERAGYGVPTTLRTCSGALLAFRDDEVVGTNRFQIGSTLFDHSWAVSPRNLIPLGVG